MRVNFFMMMAASVTCDWDPERIFRVKASFYKHLLQMKYYDFMK